MPRISVCVPSRGRASKVRTLGSVYDGAVLFVDESEAYEYESANSGARVVAMPAGVQGNIARVRNWIIAHEFGNGAEAVCMMDDDLTELLTFRGDDRTHYGYRRERLQGETFERFIEHYTGVCADMGLTMWGVNTMPSNRQYAQFKPLSLTQVVLGPFGVHLSADYRYDERMPLKEDYDMFLQHMRRERGVLRVNYAAYTNGGSGSGVAVGGCSNMRNESEERRQLALLVRKWGSDIVKADSSSKRSFDFNPIVKCPIKGA